MVNVGDINDLLTMQTFKERSYVLWEDGLFVPGCSVNPTSAMETDKPTNIYQSMYWIF